MQVPFAQESLTLGRLISLYSNALNHCMAEALAAEGDTLDYDVQSNELTYHHVLSDLDRSLFEILTGVEEIWIVTRPRES